MRKEDVFSIGPTSYIAISRDGTEVSACLFGDKVHGKVKLEELVHFYLNGHLILADTWEFFVQGSNVTISTLYNNQWINRGTYPIYASGLRRKVEHAINKRSINS